MSDLQEKYAFQIYFPIIEKSSPRDISEHAVNLKIAQDHTFIHKQPAGYWEVSNLHLL